MKAQHINPFVASAVEVFSTMLGCQLTPGQPSRHSDYQPAHDVSGIIGFSGKVFGTLVVSVDRAVAISATERMLGERPDSVNADVIDAIGELTNMIAGRAKASLEQLQMSLSLPTVITGKCHCIRFGSGSQTTRIPYSCTWGELALELNLVEEEVPTPHAKQALAH